MDLELKNKKALVSAGHKGIGFFIASRLLEEGAEVSICCREKTDLNARMLQLYADTYTFKINSDFEQVITKCQLVNRKDKGTWINEVILNSYII